MSEFTKLDALFNPKSIAVLGASTNPATGGNNYARCLIKHSFNGKVYLVNPRYREIYGLKVYPSLQEVPEPEIDYVICCTPAESLLEQIDDCSKKNVKLIHIFTARMRETGVQERMRLEDEVVEKCRELGIRVLGPNCMGVYNPKIGLTYYEDFPKEMGHVGGISQTGGGSALIIRSAAMRGVRFSKVVSYGNASDIDESELLRYFAEDPETKIVMMYIEGVRNGRRFFEALSYAAKMKVVLVLKGGIGQAGSRATFSHTGSMAGSAEIWRAALKQCGAIQVSSLEELVDVIVGFYFIPKMNGKRVLIGGGGGGISVILADAFENAGFELPDLPANVREKLKKEAPLAVDWLRNPIDSSIIDQLGVSSLDVLKAASESGGYDIVIVNFPDDAPLPYEAFREMAKEFLKGIIELKGIGNPVICIVRNSELTLDEMKRTQWEIIAELRKNLISNRIPVYSSIHGAANALKKVAEYYLSRK